MNGRSSGRGSILVALVVFTMLVVLLSKLAIAFKVGFQFLGLFGNERTRSERRHARLLVGQNNDKRVHRRREDKKQSNRKVSFHS